MNISINRRTRLLLGIMTTITFMAFAGLSFQSRPILGALFAGLALFRLFILVKQHRMSH